VVHREAVTGREQRLRRPAKRRDYGETMRLLGQQGVLIWAGSIAKEENLPRRRNTSKGVGGGVRGARRGIVLRTHRGAEKHRGAESSGAGERGFGEGDKLQQQNIFITAVDYVYDL
jgi:hypothetical protein